MKIIIKNKNERGREERDLNNFRIFNKTCTIANISMSSEDDRLREKKEIMEPNKRREKKIGYLYSYFDYLFLFVYFELYMLFKR